MKRNIVILTILLTILCSGLFAELRTQIMQANEDNREKSVNPPTNLTAAIDDIYWDKVHLAWDTPGNGGGGEFLLEDGFEDYDAFSLNFDPWTLVDVDGSTTYGFQSVDFPNSGSEMAFITFDPSATEPALEDMTAHSGNQLVCSFAATTAPNNDWMISPQVSMQDGYELSFWAKSFTDQYGLERFNVAVSTTGTNPDDFTVISGDTYTEAPVEAWTEYNYDLSEYAGQDIYVGIQCVSNDAFIFMVDDVKIQEINQRNDVIGYKVYKNGSELVELDAETMTVIDTTNEDNDVNEYYVTALNEDEESEASNIASVSIENFVKAPSNFIAETTGLSGEMEFLWDPVDYDSKRVIQHNSYNKYRKQGKIIQRKAYSDNKISANDYKEFTQTNNNVKDSDDPIVGTLLGQEAVGSDGDYSLLVSDENYETMEGTASPYLIADDFSNFTGRIEAVQFEGVLVHRNGTQWEDSDESPVTFDIVFYEGQDSIETVHTIFEDVTPEMRESGEIFASAFTGYEWTYYLDEPLDMESGYISIVGTSDNGEEDGWFMWNNGLNGNGLSYVYENDEWEEYEDPNGFSVDRAVSILGVTYNIYNENMSLKGENIDATSVIIGGIGSGDHVYYIAANDIYGQRSRTEELEFFVNANDQINALNLGSNYPNPFTSKSAERGIGTTIKFNVPNDNTNVKIDVFNVKGQKIKRLCNDTFNSGLNTVTWNGLNENNERVGTGVYFYRMKAGKYTSTKKMILIK